MLDATSTATRPDNAPADHPPVKAEKVGILLANLGTLQLLADAPLSERISLR